ncbi:hypothetical protein D1AOALGA4SA_3930 [Olavius algarvensis Delta 1 endosymbiont]|nr:hypothetical protein D1AOALGA4SA_3930 [Olavius algarvensis Delta 1 endosymbiont]
MLYNQNDGPLQADRFQDSLLRKYKSYMSDWTYKKRRH